MPSDTCDHMSGPELWSRERSRHCAVLKVSPLFVEQMLSGGLQVKPVEPLTAPRVHGIGYNIFEDCYEMLVESPDLASVPAGELAPVHRFEFEAM